MQNKVVAGLIVAGILLVMGGGVGAIYWWQVKNNRPRAVIASGTSESPSLSLNGLAPSDTSSPSTLGVSDSAQQGGGTSLQSNLGQQNTGSGTSSSSAPSNTNGPETFGQYDQYKDGQTAMFGEIQVGTGKEVAAGTKVAIYYKGWLTNGQLFDQSKAGDDGKLTVFTFTVGNHEVVAGMEQGIFGMKVGGKRRIIIPPAAGYGAQGKDPVPANAVMVFDVELVDAL